jgi:hypothetical protein
LGERLRAITAILVIFQRLVAFVFTIFAFKPANNCVHRIRAHPRKPAVRVLPLRSPDLQINPITRWLYGLSLMIRAN